MRNPCSKTWRFPKLDLEVSCRNDWDLWRGNLTSSDKLTGMSWQSPPLAITLILTLCTLSCLGGGHILVGPDTRDGDDRVTGDDAWWFYNMTSPLWSDHPLKNPLHGDVLLGRESQHALLKRRSWSCCWSPLSKIRKVQSVWYLSLAFCMTNKQRFISIFYPGTTCFNPRALNKTYTGMDVLSFVSKFIQISCLERFLSKYLIKNQSLFRNILSPLHWDPSPFEWRSKAMYFQAQ